jgi:biopolymer transport protein TolQ
VEHPFITTLTRSGPVGQSLLAGLVLLSIYTWAVIFSKAAALRKAEKSCRDFSKLFAQSGAEWLRSGRGAPIEGPLPKIFDGGLREFLVQREISGGVLHSEGARRIEASLETEIGSQVADLEKGQVALAIGASASPFIGLLGTVWGIMNAFRGMSLEGSAGIAAVAPGVAEALVTTVAGLFVAIPAVVAFNIFSRRVQVITALFDRFSTDFLRVAQFEARRATGPAGAGAAAAPSVFARRNP